MKIFKKGQLDSWVVVMSIAIAIVMIILGVSLALNTDLSFGLLD